MENDFIVKKLNNSNIEDQSIAINRLFDILHRVYAQYYPSFEIWYKQKVLDGFLNGSRSIFVVMRDEHIYGVCITKLSKDYRRTNKISTFYLRNEATGRGLGTKMLSEALNDFRLNSSSKMVHITVPDEKRQTHPRINRFEDFLYKSGFVMIEAVSGRYREGKIEYIYVLDLDKY